MKTILITGSSYILLLLYLPRAPRTRVFSLSSLIMSPLVKRPFSTRTCWNQVPHRCCLLGEHPRPPGRLSPPLVWFRSTPNILLFKATGLRELWTHPSPSISTWRPEVMFYIPIASHSAGCEVNKRFCRVELNVDWVNSHWFFIIMQLNKFKEVLMSRMNNYLKH